MARKLAVNSSRLIQVIIFDGYLYFSDCYMRCCGISGPHGEQSVPGMGKVLPRGKLLDKGALNSNSCVYCPDGRGISHCGYKEPCFDSQADILVDSASRGE